jgi:hypothetical protein
MSKAILTILQHTMLCHADIFSALASASLSLSAQVGRDV